MDMEPTVFDALRQREPRMFGGGAPQDIRFKILFDKRGAYLDVAYRKGNHAVPDYRCYSGAMRELLKALDAIGQREEMRVDWRGEGEHVYLADHDYLLWLLRECDAVVDEEDAAVAFAASPLRFSAEIVEEDAGDGTQRLRCSIMARNDAVALQCSPSMRFLNENHVLVDKTVHETQALGERFSQLAQFNAVVAKDEAELFLSLLVSTYADLPLQYEGCRVVAGAVCEAVPSVVFEKIDAAGALHMSVVPSVPGMPPLFLAEYDIVRVARINELEKTISVSQVVYDDIAAAVKDIRASLTAHAKRLSKDEGDAGSFTSSANWFVVDEALAHQFIHAELSRLLTTYTVHGSERLTAYKVRVCVPKLSLSLGAGIDFLDGDASLDIEGQSFSIADVLAQCRKQAYVKLSDGTSAIVGARYLDRLQRLFKPRDGKVHVSFFDLPVVDDMIDERIAAASLPKCRDIFLGFNTIKDTIPPLPPLRATLREYQCLGFAWLHYLHTHSLGGCLADDMGLGKTLEMLAMFATLYPGEKSPSLVVAPKSVLFNWAGEISRFAPQLTHYVYYGLDRDIDDACRHHLVLTTYGMLRNDIEAFKARRFHYAVLDEGQHIKNMETLTAKAVMLVDAAHRVALSGTPIENNLGDLYSLFRFLNPSMFGSFDEFVAQYLTPIQRDNDKEAMHDLRRKTYPFILRRLKKDVLAELPDKIEQVIYVDMGDDQKKLYEERRAFYREAVRSHIAVEGIRRSQLFILQALSELRQLASIPEVKTDGAIVSPKREALMEQLADAVANGHKVLVFANFLGVIEHVGADLEREGIAYLTMTGATHDRQRLVQRFQTDPAIRVFLMTLKTGGIGVNLTAADMVFIFDPWWNVAAETQAMDRAHRIGQDKTVFCYKLIARGSIEEKLLALQEKKSALFNAVIGTDGASLKTLDERDVEFVLG